ncbi:NAD(P)-dependent oxidoreductase [bacterium (Candidatus Blackallbacteria) CG17_big_fil_post_rev_8_21_14_2_50_48_46]|uniref:NAD(P)-dependent oxidoreductase n=1 Tax=bacterium (Candidatus Blackallbacteria) CG17_big_fil_post_rev_8_21_14_2_50_48_46 TaxID=2014261 RepID=A0A2M7G728_9BACT|nr:MAG: NAD(P)-dependent oxidoreductase [bacterium (Candidatus Blackallbacteria) CG18_big_fil_WC_8_21_14_2_50_49_26]PIW17855.1 MAG: NAD(P)-dependent oxidoreductase [bacterium (Candidatus Blackallbacteria) CG17_big_fil_post_rev_8_21_14_2_50_48_46]PIW48531.1 MAG: NAD(P)-dependent oxidoreductase [bacterium (Candidatus Blackallbacteria) CG13_big_fil_rev_8_21_14_2_50_49_14]
MDLGQYFAGAGHSLQGLNALVTGASSGIGLATACQLAAQGVNLKLVARRLERLEKIKQALAERFPAVSIEILGADLAQPESWQRLEQAGFYTVDILVNNAGLARGRDKVVDSSWQDWQAMIDLNISAAFEVTRRVVPGMLARGQGDIVCLGSAAGQIPYEGGSVYCASKYALRAFCQVLRRETCGQNLRVMLISPGMVETEFSVVRLGQEAAQKVYAGMQPLTPAEVAAQILFALQQPRHLNWDELLLMATAQGGVEKVVRQIEN